MINKATIKVNKRNFPHSDYSDGTCRPDKARCNSIKDDYLLLPPTMRSVATQVAIATHFEKKRFRTTAAFIHSLNYSDAIQDEDTDIDVLTNFWYKARAGKAIIKSDTLNRFFNAIDLSSAEILRHPLWFFFDKRKPFKVVLTQFIERCRVDLTEIEKRWLFFKRLPMSARKQPSNDVRMSIFTDRPIDLFVALLLKTLNELKECNQPRPAPTERYVYALFLFLFGYKYKILKCMQLSQLANILLTPNSTSASRQQFERRIRFELRKVNQTAESLSQKNNDEVEVQLSNFILQRSLSKNNKCFS